MREHWNGACDCGGMARRKNQPPTGTGKQQPRHGEPDKLTKRSVVVQAKRGRPDLNLGDAEEERARRSGPRERPKAGR